MRIFKQKSNIIMQPKGCKCRFSNQGFVDSTFDAYISKFDKKDCLDLGSGIHGILDGRFVTVDIEPELNEVDEDGNITQVHKPDIVGDIKACFAPPFNKPKYLMKNSDLLEIAEGAWAAVRLRHIAEHIPWIYQYDLWKWVYSLLQDYGMLYIATPNLAFIMGSYFVNLKRLNNKEVVEYPIHEHKYLRHGIQWDMQRWVNFKLFSGCSPGDKHHCCYDAFMLTNMLYEMGFRKMVMVNGPNIGLIGYKEPSSGIPADDVLGESVKRAVGDK